MNSYEETAINLKISVPNINNINYRQLTDDPLSLTFNAFIIYTNKNQ